jgi:hypothetical protein
LIILLVIAAVAGFLAYHFLRRPVAIGDPEELPLLGSRVAAKIAPSDETPADQAPPSSVSPSSDGASLPSSQVKAEQKE